MTILAVVKENRHIYSAEQRPVCVGGCLRTWVFVCVDRCVTVMHLTIKYLNNPLCLYN